MTGRVEGKCALVTGGGRGIGAAIALRLAAEGAKVGIMGPRAETLNGTVEAAAKRGQKIEPFVGDVTSEDDVGRTMDALVRTLGRIDVLVNNAGVLLPKPFFERTSADFRRTFEVNLIGVFLCAQAAARHMLDAKSGKIVNISSVRGVEHCGREGVIDYSASKAAVVSFTKTLAKQLAPHVTVNAVGPGHTRTEMLLGQPAAVTAPMLAGTPLGRFAEPEDIANAVLFFSSPEADFITGQHLVVDGGFSLK